MSPRVDPATILPAPKPRQNDPLALMIAEALDHQLLGCAETGEAFTTSDIRDRLLKQPELDGTDPTQLRYRVRDRLKTLERQDLVEHAGVRGKNRRLYRMQLDTPAEPSESTPPSPSSTQPQPASEKAPTRPLLEHLEQERHYLQTAMHAAIGEAEHYQQLIVSFPDERSQIAPLLEVAIEHSGRLKGQWDANLKVRQRLADSGEGDVSPMQGERS
ncbi:hypothetical protein [uncultured Halomonas sp.]|uniref:hypothetical protein n=1 Tax=uncultured Halomonas sp. TaxID=173971 RepID=UPI0026194B4D|nr:hypothetical protein [uncultured Halomonas sp.]